jgi:hypothetical protein
VDRWVYSACLCFALNREQQRLIFGLYDKHVGFCFRIAMPYTTVEKDLF